MAPSLITKKKIAKSFKDLLKNDDFEKISVSMIMEYTKIRRQTFYEYFLDKYDLIEWIFLNELKEQVTDNLTYISGYQLLHEITLFFSANRQFYRKLFLIVGQNDFSSYFNEYCKQIIEKIIREYRQQPFNNHKDHNFFVEYHSYALSNLIKNIILNEDQDMNIKIKQFIHLIQTSINHC